MPKSTRASFSTRQSVAGSLSSVSASVRSLLTDAERTFLESSFGSSVEKATEKMLQTAIRRARDLRDKWLDKFTRQNRSTKRSRGGAVKGALGSPVATAASNVRSREKAELFDGALRRFEERLRAILEPKVTVEAKVAATAPRKSSRSAKSSRPTKASSALVGRRPATRTKASKSGRSRKALDVATLATRSVSASGQRVRTDAAGQRSVKAAARRARESMQGLAMHRNAHAAARVKRAQVRRDVRNG
ncbi:MAG: hypothetical protein ACKOCN_01715 [Planctomycetaceae bacterium]